MNFSQYCKKLYPHMPFIDSQTRFVVKLFIAAGSNKFNVKTYGGVDTYPGKLFRGERIFSSQLKNTFPSRCIDIAGLAGFFEASINGEALKNVMNAFGTQSDGPNDKELFCLALCMQMQALVSAEKEDAEDVVSSQYKSFLAESKESGTKISPYDIAAFYVGDDFSIYSQMPQGMHIVDIYEVFEHTWTLINSGSVAWENRQLKCTNESTTPMKPEISSINIPTTNPLRKVKLTIRLDSRGEEGDYVSVWEIIDENGNSCFPRRKALRIPVKVSFKRKIPTERSNNGYK